MPPLRIIGAQFAAPLQTNFGIHEVVDDYRRLLDRKDIDAAYLSAGKGMRVELDKI
jgi:hypothetical protein